MQHAGLHRTLLARSLRSARYSRDCNCFLGRDEAQLRRPQHIPSNNLPLRRLRGLADALETSNVILCSSTGDAVGAGAARRPWALDRLSVALFASGADGISKEQAASSCDASQQDAFAGRVIAAGRPRLPQGHIDFQQRQLMMIYTCSVCETRSAKARPSAVKSSCWF